MTSKFKKSKEKQLKEEVSRNNAISDFVDSCRSSNRYPKYHLLYGPSICDNNKLVAVYMELTDLLPSFRPVFDLIIDAGYSMIGEVNLGVKEENYEEILVFKNHYDSQFPFLFNGDMGFPACPKWFSRMRLHIYIEESHTDKPQDLYSVVLDQNDS